MMLAAVAGALLGAALLVLARALAGPRAGLSEQLATIEAATSPASTVASGRGLPVAAGLGEVGWWASAVQGVRARLVAGGWSQRLIGSQLRADLELLGVDHDSFVARKLVTSVVAFVLAPVAMAGLAVAAGAPWLLGAWVALLLAVAVFVLPDRRLHVAATARRRDFTSTLCAYMDLVAMRAASGSGVPEALRQPVLIGDGYAWRRLQLALEDARMEGKAPATGLARLGSEIDVPDLADLAAQLALVESTGPRAEATLLAKAEALRSRQVAELHGDANARTESMRVASVLLGLGFLLLIGYPAVAAVMQL